MTENRNVWVFIEQDDGRIAEVSLELLAKGRELADKLGSQLWAVLCGHTLREIKNLVIHHGADRVLAADHPQL